MLIEKKRPKSANFCFRFTKRLYVKEQKRKIEINQRKYYRRSAVNSAEQVLTGGGAGHCSDPVNKKKKKIFVFGLVLIISTPSELTHMWP